MDRGLKRRDFKGGYQQNYPSHSTRKVYFTPINKVPPITQGEFEGLVIDYLTCNPTNKIDSLTLLRNIQSCYRANDNSIYVFKTFSINDAVRDLYNNNLIECREIFIGVKRAYLITKIHEQSLKKYKADNNDKFMIKPTIDKYNEISKKIANSFLGGKTYDNDKKDYLFHSMYESDNDNDYKNKNLIIEEDIMYSGNDNIFLGKKIEHENIEEDKAKNDLLEMLNQDSLKNKNIKNVEDELTNLIHRPSAKALLTSDNYHDYVDILKKTLNTDYSQVLEKIKAKYGSSLVRPFCEYGTRLECAKHNKTECKKVHFKTNNKTSY